MRRHFRVFIYFYFYFYFSLQSLLLSFFSAITTSSSGNVTTGEVWQIIELMKFLELFFTFLRLGLTSFGGPVAHLSYFHDEFVKKKKWIDEHAYADLVALCQFLPGPASSQVGMAIGLGRAGVLGAITAWIGFTIPSAIILVLFGLGMTHLDLSSHEGWIHGLKIAAVSVVAQAVYGMGRKLCPDKERLFIAVVSSAIVLLFNSAAIQVLVLVCAGILGSYFFKDAKELPHVPMESGLKKRTGVFLLISFGAILISLPLLRSIVHSQTINLFDSFFRAGSLVFGGGHVVLPLLQSEVVTTGWISKDLFMAGYGLAQAIPGPLFTFSAYLGAVSSIAPNGWLGGAICLIAAFLPSFLLVGGVLPFWEKLRGISKIRQAMMGINAAVVGILLAALYHPVWTSAIFTIKDFSLAFIGFLLLEYWKLSSWIVVLISAIVGFYLLNI